MGGLFDMPNSKRKENFYAVCAAEGEHSMYKMDKNANIKVSQGDTLPLRLIVKGITFTPDTVAYFGITDDVREVRLLQLKLPVKITEFGGVIDVPLTHRQMKKLRTGMHKWDLRTKSRTDVITYFDTSRTLEVKDVASDGCLY